MGSPMNLATQRLSTFEQEIQSRQFLRSLRSSPAHPSYTHPRYPSAHLLQRPLTLPSAQTRSHPYQSLEQAHPQASNR
jgi:hypothetical protein